MRIKYGRSVLGVATALAVGLSSQSALASSPADLIIDQAKIYTASGAQMAEAMAVSDGKIIYVGSHAGVQAFKGPQTQLRMLHGAVVLPGLIDTHIHPLDIVDLDVCDLHSQSLTLEQISQVVRGCVAHYHLKPGQWLSVYQWNNTGGNQPSARLKNLRAALDAGAPNNPVTLLGNDGHHGAYNSVALKGAKNRRGEVVGLTSATLDREFAAFKTLIGVDAQGEPDGVVNENARYLVDSTEVMDNAIAEIAKNPERVVRKLNSVGLTGMMDAYVPPHSIPIYEALEKRNHLTVWTNLALYFDPFIYSDDQGRVQFKQMVDEATVIRQKFVNDKLIKADTVKVFADGVLEGNPYSEPPTLPDSPSSTDYLQPIFQSKNNLPSVVGYVDTHSAVCEQVRSQKLWAQSATVISQFKSQHGYHPGQCQLMRGQFQDPPDVQMQLVNDFHQAGFNVHIHAISDAAVSLAISAIENARASDGNDKTRDGLAHVQLAQKHDVERMGRDHLFVAYTYAWMIEDPEYDLSVIPFIQKVHGQSFAELHPPGNPYDEMVYPVKDTQTAGAILTAGSDAPVETRDPRPFVNITRAVSRRLPDSKLVLTPRQALSLDEALLSYTSNAAKALGRETEIGSLDVGKSADWVVIDRDIFALDKQRQYAAMEKTQVLETWFQGKRVYRKKAKS